MPWDLFREIIAGSGYIWADRALGIMSIGEDDNPIDNNRRMNRLRALEGGNAWRIIRRDILPKLRSALVITTIVRIMAEEDPDTDNADSGEISDIVSLKTYEYTENEHQGIGEDYPDGSESAEKRDASPFYAALFSNLILDALAIPNIGVEFYLAKKWSLGVSGYYSGWNYFRSDLKFRTLAIMPELRFWPRRGRGDSNGLFIDVHGGCAWYNMAFGGRSRYQDHDGDTPAYGGGVGVGYRLPVGSGPWRFEFAAGAGVYRLDFDVYENKPEGRLKDRVRKWYKGLDRLTVSIVYAFGSKIANKKSSRRSDRKKGGEI